jgi:hypothetical protein
MWLTSQNLKPENIADEKTGCIFYVNKNREKKVSYTSKDLYAIIEQHIGNRTYEEIADLSFHVIEYYKFEKSFNISILNNRKKYLIKQLDSGSTKHKYKKLASIKKTNNGFFYGRRY